MPREILDLGLAAIGSHGGWEVAIDETTSGVHNWFMQIEGGAVYLNLSIPSPQIVNEVLDFLAPRQTPNTVPQSTARTGEIVIGRSGEEEVTLVRDDEFLCHCIAANQGRPRRC
jgi:hypothetical protein